MALDILYTSLATNETFLRGLNFLYASLKRVNSKYPFIAMITDNIPQQTIESILDKEISYKLIPYYQFDRNPEYESDFWLDCINKLQSFEFASYDLVCFLDADLFILKNIDDLCTSLFQNVDIFNKKFFYIKRIRDMKTSPNVLGEFFFVKPTPNEFLNKLHTYKTYRTDEETFEGEYTAKGLSVELLDDSMPLTEYFFHGSGRFLKYFDLLQLSAKDFCRITDNQVLQSFFQFAQSFQIYCHTNNEGELLWQK